MLRFYLQALHLFRHEAFFNFMSKFNYAAYIEMTLTFTHSRVLFLFIIALIIFSLHFYLFCASFNEFRHACAYTIIPAYLKILHK